MSAEAVLSVGGWLRSHGSTMSTDELEVEYAGRRGRDELLEALADALRLGIVELVGPDRWRATEDPR